MEAAIEEKAGAARAMRCWGVDFNTLPRGEREREREGQAVVDVTFMKCYNLCRS